jgi:SAM-dependent methyltransferase
VFLTTVLYLLLPQAATAAAASGQTASQTNIIFDPSLSLQRRRLVSQLVKQQQAATVVDIGCGEGALLKHLLCDCGFTNLSRIVGVDVSGNALAAAARKLEGLGSQWLAVGDEAAAGGHVPATGAGDNAAAAAAAADTAAPAAAADAAVDASLEGAPVPASEGDGSTLTGLLMSGTAAAATAAPTLSGPASSEVHGGSFTQVNMMGVRLQCTA